MNLLARKRIACIAACLSLAPFAFASDSPNDSKEPTGILTLAQAVEAALMRNPELKASSFELKAADARIQQAGFRPNPDFSVEAENFGGSGIARGTQALETTLSLSQIVEIGGKRRTRTDVATLDRESIAIERQARQLDVLAEVARRFIALVATQERTQLLQNALEVEQRTLAAISTRVQAARSPEAELSRARIAVTRAQIELQQGQAELRSNRLALASVWGSQQTLFTQAQGDLFTLGPVESYDTLIRQLARNPDFTRFASEARLRDAEVRLAQAQARPNLTFSVGFRRLKETSDNALVAGFSMPLPVFNRNQGAIREAEVRRAQTDAVQEAALIRAQATVFSLYQELSAVRARVESLRNDALPQAQQALEQTQYGYDRGRFSYLELATSQQELLELRVAALEAAADYHRILIEIERLTGEPLTADNTTQE